MEKKLTAIQRMKLEKALGGPLIDVRVDPVGLPDHCFANCRVMTKEKGGTVQYGWGLAEFGLHPSIVAAVNHAVWRQPNGELIDLTPDATIDPSKGYWTNGGRRYFVPDDTAAPLSPEEAIQQGRHTTVNANRVIVMGNNSDAKRAARRYQRYEYSLFKTEAPAFVMCV